MTAVPGELIRLEPPTFEYCRTGDFGKVEVLAGQGWRLVFVLPVDGGFVHYLERAADEPGVGEQP